MDVNNDNIILDYKTSGDLDEAIKLHASMIQEQTLSKFGKLSECV